MVIIQIVILINLLLVIYKEQLAFDKKGIIKIKYKFFIIIS